MRAPRIPIDIQAYLAQFEPPATPEDALSKLPRLASRLKNRDFAGSAAMVAGLATERAFHAHQVRLDWAIRILSASATGSRPMDRVALDRLLNEDFPKLQLHAQEDPLEQPFVGRVVTRHGAFHLLAGVFDQSAAFTDLIVSAFEVLPGPETAGPMARALALLRLSDALLERAQEDVWSLGPDTPVAKVKLPSPADLTLLAARAHFSEMDLVKRGINPGLLESFRLTEADLPLVAASPVGASPLDRRPLWRSGEDWIVLAPGSISVAVRSCLIDAVVELKLQRAMAMRMLSIQHDRLTECGFLKDGPEAIVDHGGQPALDRLIELSPGRFCHVLETVDGFDGWPERGLGSDTACPPAHEAAFARSVAEARSAARGSDDFREGFTLWLAGGWGAGRNLSARLIDRFPDWPVTIIEPGDACILGLGESGELRDVMRLESVRRRVASDGYELHHPGTWLNFYAYWLENNHDLLPSQLDLEPPANIQFGLLRQAEIRADGYKRWDRTALPHPRFGWGTMSRMERMPFSGDLEPIYASFDGLHRQRLIGAAVDPSGVAWIEGGGEADRETVYQSWHAALLWWLRIWPVWARWSGEAFSLIDLVLSVDPIPMEDWTAVTDARIDAALRIWREPEGVVRLHLGQDWHHGAMRPDNRSEWSLAAALLEAAAAGLGRNLDRATAIELVRDVTSADVRHRHAHEVARVIEALGAAGVVQPFRRMSHTAMTSEKYGSVWRVRPRDAPSEVRGVEDCVALVRACIAREVTDLRAMVARYDRAGLVAAALGAQQAAMLEARTWETTARATRAIHGVERDLNFSQEQRNHIHSVLRCSSLIAEFGQVDAALSGGLAVGHMDLEELQAKVMALIHVADMLPALISGQQAPLLRVSPSGDLQSDRRFSDTTLKATAIQLHAMDRLQADRNYDRRLERPAASEPDDDGLGSALKAEYGVPQDILREFPMGVAHLAIAGGSDIYVGRRSRLLADLAQDELLADADLAPLIDRLTLPTRNGWTDLPNSLAAGDFDVSKFDRPRSLIARPILALTEGPDPLLAVGPAVVERALVHNLSGALGGDLQNRFWSSLEMQRFASRQGARTGLEFNAEVAQAVGEQGLNSWSERTMSWCLNRKKSDEMDRLGDIDVLGVSEADNLVWVIEAKDLKLCRTLGEVARRLANYQGRTDEKGRPDALLKHLRRVAFLRANAVDLGKRLGLSQPPKVCGLVIVRSPQPMSQLTGKFYDDARVALLDHLEEIPWRAGWTLVGS
ncbi:hypothetical protein EJ082_15135 [Brevundimonas diminuta]|uniref:Uncharacterized protein n=1 Tax=Brevundimonas diminuta TaxID=293 RepID=A0A410P0A3_BREDI|nr:hypothetical protein [Brevundimonas diminuta]MBD3574300.1 hypothetical protein [Brevundimonas diminuta]QAT15543.1 hypothetical protein EQG53_15000 [Brevundimonas diminuta]QQB90240.1 hypothetical protein I6H83_07450 [Brevundimonas diminuta]GEC02239.1 hypothetical protein BDI01nite_33030 [Brevundimonas diminuta]